MHITLAQLASSTDVDANLARIAELTATVGSTDLLVLPEAVMADFGKPDTPLGPLAQPLDGPFTDAIAGLARRTGATVVAGMFERSEDAERPFNTLLAVGPDGALQAHYRKAHLYDSFGYRESDRLQQGELVPAVLHVGDVGLGLMTCYDLRFPEHSRALVDAGADVLVVPAAWVRGPLKEEHWQTLLHARAIENTAYVAAAAQCGRRYCGHSRLVDPMGVVVAGIGEAEGAIAASVSRDRIAEVRATNPALEHRRWQVSAP